MSSSLSEMLNTAELSWEPHWPTLLLPSEAAPAPAFHPLYTHWAFLKLTPCKQGCWGVFQPHQPNCSSFPARKRYKVWSCTSQCPNFNHLSTLIDTNGFYKCKSLSSSKLHVFEENIERKLPGKCSPNILKAGREPSIPKPCAFAQQSLKRLGCYY